MNRINVKLGLALTLTILVLPFFVLAQLDLAGQFLNLNITPENPLAGQTVTAKVESFSVDLNRVQISWFVNGRRVSSGVGKVSQAFTVGPIGSATTLEVVVTKSDGSTLSEKLTIRPAEVDLLWQSDTYLPPFYSGKALHTSESAVRVVAFPNLVAAGRKVSAGNLVYQWKRNGKPLPALSGFGKREIKFSGAKLFGQDLIEVEVSTRDNLVRARGQTLIKTVEPEIIFYPVRPLDGLLFNQPIGRIYELTDEELTVRAEPYYFSLAEVDSGRLLFSWLLNGQRISASPADPALATFREEGGAGENRVSLSIENPDKILQSASRSFVIVFGETNFNQ